jgi:hypothetical protein
MANMDTANEYEIQSPDDREHLYAMSGTTLHELASIIESGGAMLEDYGRHYPEIIEYVADYRKNHTAFIRYSHLETDRVTEHEILVRIAVGVSAGFYFLTPPVALYLMRICPAAFINAAGTYARNERVNWPGMMAQVGFLITIMGAVCLEMGSRDPMGYLATLVDGLPVPKSVRDSVLVDAKGYLNEQLADSFGKLASH